MYGLLINDGDLVVTHRDYQHVTGTGKIAQDLRVALMEPQGNDRFHPGWGSVLDQYIAQIADESTRTQVESEINRVISNYAAIQRDKIEADIVGDTATRFATDEILSRIIGIDVTVLQDSINAVIGLQAVSGEVLVLNEAVS